MITRIRATATSVLDWALVVVVGPFLTDLDHDDDTGDWT
jgi:hypothetical protein